MKKRGRPRKEIAPNEDALSRELRFLAGWRDKIARGTPPSKKLIRKLLGRKKGRPDALVDDVTGKPPSKEWLRVRWHRWRQKAARERVALSLSEEEPHELTGELLHEYFVLCAHQMDRDLNKKMKRASDAALKKHFSG
jgi:hypothetical protein